MVLFGPSPGPASAEAIRQIQCRGVAVGLLSHRPAQEVESLASSLGVELRVFGLSSHAKVELLKNLARRGRKVAYVGDPAREPEVAREAHVSISMAADSDPATDQSHVRVLRNDLGCLAPCTSWPAPISIAFASSTATTLIPNLACIAGALFLGFTSLTSVVLTNLGTLAIYSGLPRRRKSPVNSRHQAGPRPVNLQAAPEIAEEP